MWAMFLCLFCWFQLFSTDLDVLVWINSQRKPVLLGCFLYIVFYRKQQVQVGLKIWGSCKWPQRLETQPRSWKFAQLVVETITQVPATVSQCTGLSVHSEYLLSKKCCRAALVPKNEPMSGPSRALKKLRFWLRPRSYTMLYL